MCHHHSQHQNLHHLHILTLELSFCKNLGWTSLYFSRWCLIVAFRKKGLDDTPKTTWLKWKAWILGIFSGILSTHRNQRASLSLGQTEIIKNVFSTSATRADWNRTIISMIFCPNLGPVYGQLFNARSLVLAEALYTTLSLVVSLSLQMTAWWGR